MQLATRVPPSIASANVAAVTAVDYTDQVTQSADADMTLTDAQLTGQGTDALSGIESANLKSQDHTVTLPKKQVEVADEDKHSAEPEVDESQEQNLQALNAPNPTNFYF